MKKNGFTLVELMIVVTIIIILAVMMVGIFNATGVYDKARDAQRKKDLGRIKIAFEEYYNDKGCYPNQDVVAQLSSVANCQTNIFAPWLQNWPCDPNKSPYIIVVEDKRLSQCNKWYKIFANLENKKDTAIPTGWSYLESFIVGGEITSNMVNYGVSSSNINWFDKESNPECAMFGGCYYLSDMSNPNGICNSAGTGCVGPNCFIGMCKSSCQVACCGVGCR